MSPSAVAVDVEDVGEHRNGSKAVCVLDASGHLGRALVDRLLHCGYTVHAAVCGSAGDAAAAVGTLAKVAAAGENGRRLKLFRADPLDYPSVVDALKGCSGLFYAFDGTDGCSTYDEVTVELEVRAAHNVLEACAQTETLERVVFTSSVTAVVWKDGRREAEAFDERDWSEIGFCRRHKLWHALAKTLSEKTAWAMALDRGVDMVSVNAGLILTGQPGLSPLHPYLKGAPDMYGDGTLVTVTIDFLADTHLAVYEAPTAYGRYLCFNHAICQPEDAVELARLIDPQAPCPPPSDELKSIQGKLQNKKLNKLMVAFASGMHLELDF